MPPVGAQPKRKTIQRRASAFEEKFANRIAVVRKDGSFSAETTRPRRDATVEEQLYYSKKPRKVNYKPYSLSDYSTMRDKIQHRGVVRLGPDLESDKVKSAKEQREKMMTYSKEINQTNITTLTAAKRSPPKSQKKVYTIVNGHAEWAAEEAVTTAKDKALEYAATRVPKPIPMKPRRMMQKPAYAFGGTQPVKVSPYSRERVLDHIATDSLSTGAKIAVDGGGPLTLQDMAQRHESEMAAVNAIMEEFA